MDRLEPGACGTLGPLSSLMPSNLRSAGARICPPAAVYLPEGTGEGTGGGKGRGHEDK